MPPSLLAFLGLRSHCCAARIYRPRGWGLAPLLHRVPREAPVSVFRWLWAAIPDRYERTRRALTEADS